MKLKELLSITKHDQLFEIQGMFLKSSDLFRKDRGVLLEKDVSRIWPDSSAAVSNQEFIHVEVR